MNAATRDAVERELERLLESGAFRGSRRSSDFLRYVVHEALEGRAAAIKERTIGVEVFGRPPGYETGDDAIVRVKANEVRKRLAQAYQDQGYGPDVAIELPPGTYVPEFRTVTNGVTPLSARPGPRIWWWMGALAGLAVVLAAANQFWPRDAFHRFWAPVLERGGPVTLCVANPAVFTMSAEMREAETPTVDRSDLTKDNEHFVGIGDAQAMARLAGFLSGHGRKYLIRPGNDTSFTDLRQAPAILIGAFTNQWTMELTGDLRFVFEREPGGRIWVQDQQPPGQRFEFQQSQPPMDFVIISRVFDSRTGQAIMTAAGLAHLGTQVAGEFLTTPEYMNEALAGAPSGWERKNLQIVLRAEVLGQAPGPPRVVALHAW
jgi:hypothetical protein